MSANYLHGVETTEIDRSPRPVKVVKSAVIGLICTAPMGPVNTPTLCLLDTDAAQFGAGYSGFTAPQALDAIYDHGAGTVIVVNVLDPATHITVVATESQTLVNDVCKTAHAAVKAGTLVVKNAAGVVTYVKGTDYTADEQSGTITRIAGSTIAAGAQLTLSYTYLDPTKVLASDIIGTVNVAGFRTGLKALRDTFNLYGFFAKVILAPAYCTQTSVSTEMIATATALGAMTLIDAPIGTTFAQALAGRGPAGSINFNTSSERAILCYPHLKCYDTVTKTERLEPMSQRMAGVMAAKDLTNGYWWSPSNTEFQGITGVERPLTARIDDPSSEVNLLNENGICTVFNSYGTGWRTWGNRSSAFPTVTATKQFINVRRTGDIINESLRYWELQHCDQPITQGLIDALVASVNAFGRKQIGDGALRGFKCWFDPARNDATELSAGHLVLNYKYTVPPPMERLTFETEITDEYLFTLKAA